MSRNECGTANLGDCLHAIHKFNTTDKNFNIRLFILFAELRSKTKYPRHHLTKIERPETIPLTLEDRASETRHKIYARQGLMISNINTI